LSRWGGLECYLSLSVIKITINDAVVIIIIMEENMITISLNLLPSMHIPFIKNRKNMVKKPKIKAEEIICFLNNLRFMISLKIDKSNDK
jgi:hypothetical protein